MGGKDLQDKVSGKCYHYVNKELQEIQSMLRPRLSFGSFVNSEVIYTAGGIDSEGQAVDYVDKYALTDGHNTHAGHWYEMTALPEAIYNVSIHVFSTYNLVAAGGINQQNKCVDSLYILDIEKSKTWRKLRATLTTPACNIGIHQSEIDKLLIFGGWCNDKKLNTVCQLIEKNNQFRIPPTSVSVMQFPDQFFVNGLFRKDTDDNVLIPG